MSIRIAPSILSADLGRLADEVREAEAAGADWIHVDAMDGQFVPNITVGPVVLQAVRRATALPLDVHLMVVDPDRHLEAFAEAGADILSIQLEATRHPQRTLARIRALGKRAGLVVNPHTPEEAVRYLLPDIDVLLVMTVNPGFSGQRFLPQVLPKIRVLREWLDREGIPVELEVDGGIHPGTAREVVAAGATVLVAGTAVFGQRDRRQAIAALRAAAAVR
ncbi:MAG: ribulose-phosphate 3-epimerase [Pseudomonadota bacterium]|nr:MAG: ribulose-phosphate 3-epimerase [Pseudomonadota bacterium]